MNQYININSFASNSSEHSSIYGDSYVPTTPIHSHDPNRHHLVYEVSNEHLLQQYINDLKASTTRNDISFFLSGIVSLRRLMVDKKKAVRIAKSELKKLVKKYGSANKVGLVLGIPGPVLSGFLRNGKSHSYAMYLLYIIKGVESIDSYTARKGASVVA